LGREGVQGRLKKGFSNDGAVHAFGGIGARGPPGQQPKTLPPVFVREEKSENEVEARRTALS